MSAETYETKVLVCGANGMLGHKLVQVLAPHCDVVGTVRDEAARYAVHPVLGNVPLVGGMRAENAENIPRVLDQVRPDVVVNCIGIVKQAAKVREPYPTIMVNALFPHHMARECRTAGARMIHISTDCVFSGKKGGYREEDLADATDLYGRTKVLGEVSYPGCLTLRTSMIGRELATSYGLVEWFLSQTDRKVQGYRQAVFSGLTTLVLSRVMWRIIKDHRDMEGVWHVASEAISKFDLLVLIKNVYGLPIEIEPDDAVMIDRSLNPERFFKATGIAPPSWPEMIEEMHADGTPYEQLRGIYAHR